MPLYSLPPLIPTSLKEEIYTVDVDDQFIC